MICETKPNGTDTLLLMIAVSGPLTWNSLSDSLREPELSLDTFKRQLKTYFCEILTTKCIKLIKKSFEVCACEKCLQTEEFSWKYNIIYITFNINHQQPYLRTPVWLTSHVLGLHTSASQLRPWHSVQYTGRTENLTALYKFTLYLLTYLLTVSTVVHLLNETRVRQPAH